MIQLAIAGAAGRMGQSLISACEAHESFALAHAFEQPGHESVGQSAGSGQAPVTLTDGIDGPSFDVLIDFTSPAASLANLAFCAEQGRKAVIGTTGFSDSDRARMAELAEKTAVVWAPNMSVGVNITLRLLELAARAFGDEVDVEIIEAHHRHKVDAPSGTAVRMGEILADALGRDLATDAIYGREGITGARERKTIGFSTIRGGDIVGEHTVLFAGEGERIEITHRAQSRMNFAQGALQAARYIADRPPGMYDMQGLLNL